MRASGTGNCSGIYGYKTIAKRLFRAKQKIKQEKLSLDVPDEMQMPTRLDAVLHAIYLLFNEGYKSASDAGVIRRELCASPASGRLCREANPETSLKPMPCNP